MSVNLVSYLFKLLHFFVSSIKIFATANTPSFFNFHNDQMKTKKQIISDFTYLNNNVGNYVLDFISNTIECLCFYFSL